MTFAKARPAQMIFITTSYNKLLLRNLHDLYIDIDLRTRVRKSIISMIYIIIIIRI